MKEFLKHGNRINSKFFFRKIRNFWKKLKIFLINIFRWQLEVFMTFAITENFDNFFSVAEGTFKLINFRITFICTWHCSNTYLTSGRSLWTCQSKWSEKNHLTSYAPGRSNTMVSWRCQRSSFFVSLFSNFPKLFQIFLLNFFFLITFITE